MDGPSWVQDWVCLVQEAIRLGLSSKTSRSVNGDFFFTSPPRAVRLPTSKEGIARSVTSRKRKPSLGAYLMKEAASQSLGAGSHVPGRTGYDLHSGYLDHQCLPLAQMRVTHDCSHELTFAFVMCPFTRQIIFEQCPTKMAELYPGTSRTCGTPFTSIEQPPMLRK